MIKLYERLVRGSKNNHRLNRTHRALENWMTPEQWHTLHAELLKSPKHEFLREEPIAEAESTGNERHKRQAQWFAAMQEMYGKAPSAAPQPFARYRVRRDIAWYKKPGSSAQGKTLLVCYLGDDMRMPAPLPVLLQHIDASTTDLLLIRHIRREDREQEIASVVAGKEVDRSKLGEIDNNARLTLGAQLRGLLPVARYERRVAIGSGRGGLAGVLAALKSNFDAALAINGDPPFRLGQVRIGGLGALRLIRNAHKESKSVPLFLVYGDRPKDEKAAQALATLLPATLIRLNTPGQTTDHAAAYPLIMSGKLSDFLKKILSEPDKAKTDSALKLILPPKSEIIHGTGKLPELTGPRYFGIGFNKTGTTTIGHCFKALGLTPIAEPQSMHFYNKDFSADIFERGDFQPALEAARYFRSFQDRPWNIWNIHELLDQKFEGSFFIMTERDPESWWGSVERWLLETHKTRTPKLQRYLHHLKVDRMDKQVWIDAYNRRNDEVKEYFAGKDNLFLIDLAHSEGWEPLCKFLGLPIPDTEFPHANQQAPVGQDDED